MITIPYRVYVDPGHGGVDPGAVNERLALNESDINLSLSLNFKSRIDSGDYLFQVKLPRHTDKYVSLEQRVLEANAWKADIFLSFHCNACDNPNVRGFEVWTSEGETRADLLATQIFNILRETIPNSPGRTDYDDGDPDKEKNFYVLRNTKMPAVLIEFGFISNDEQAKFLNEYENQYMIVDALADTVEGFLEGGEHEWIA
jgi:N-acetylmuramoyl-L-alanine amidase